MNIELLTDETFKEKLESNQKMAVKYYADWCGSCKLITPKYKRLAADERFSDITFADINAEQSEEARKMAGVDSLPYFAIFKDGALVEGTATSKIERVEELIKKLN